MASGLEIRKLGFDVWVPLEKTLIRRPRAKPLIRERSLFGPYGFVWIDLEQPYGDILDCDGVIGLLPNAHRPIPVAEYIIDGLKMCESVGVFDHTKPPRVGQRVEVLDGAFASMVGRIVRARAADRVKVMLKILGSMREVEMPLMSLREVSP